MAIEVGTFEAKNKLSELLAQVEKGEQVYITRRGKRVALLTSAVTNPRQDDEALASRFKRLRRRAKSGPESLKSLVEEGRR